MRSVRRKETLMPFALREKKRCAGEVRPDPGDHLHTWVESICDMTEAPLERIQQSTEMLEWALASCGRPVLGCMEFIERDVANITRMVRLLQKQTKKGAAQREAVELGSIIASALDAIDIAPGVRVGYAPPDREIWVWSDPRRLRVVSSLMLDQVLHKVEPRAVVRISCSPDLDLAPIHLGERCVTREADRDLTPLPRLIAGPNAANDRTILSRFAEACDAEIRIGRPCAEAWRYMLRVPSAPPRNNLEGKRPGYEIVARCIAPAGRDRPRCGVPSCP
jgi:hypothetical protein